MSAQALRRYEAATERALDVYPAPAEDAPESEKQAWARQVQTYRDHVLRGWEDEEYIPRLAEAAARCARESGRAVASPGGGSSLRHYSVDALLQLDIPVREYLLAPWLREKEIAMVHAWRGVGKTLVGLNIAYAVASGGSFLGWRAPHPRSVLYVDGEMPARTMQERLAAIVAASPQADTFDPKNLQLVCADLQDGPLPNLSTSAGQSLIEPLVHAADLVVVDSISTLASWGRENEAESWLPMQAWAMDLRRRGKSTLLFHHDGKGGQQRGTSRKEDILDVTIGLRRPSDYEVKQGARFEVHFDKARSVFGEDADPFEAMLELVDGSAVWTTRRLDDARSERAAAMFRDQCSPADVAQELGVSRATAYRLKKQLAAKGILS